MRARIGAIVLCLILIFGLGSVVLTYPHSDWPALLMINLWVILVGAIDAIIHAILAILLVRVGIDVGLGSFEQQNLHGADRPRRFACARDAHGKLASGQESLDQDRLLIHIDQHLADRLER